MTIRTVVQHLSINGVAILCGFSFANAILASGVTTASIAAASVAAALGSQTVIQIGLALIRD